MRTHLSFPFSARQKGKISLDFYKTKLYIRRKQDNRLFRLFDILQSNISIEDTRCCKAIPLFFTGLSII